MSDSSIWSKCPNCNGSGVIEGRDVCKTCHTCNGHGIINELTGFPPKDSYNELNETFPIDITVEPIIYPNQDGSGFKMFPFTGLTF